MQDNSTRTPYFPANLDDYARWVAIHGLVAPYGECQCGCGQKTTISKSSQGKNHVSANQPYRFIKGHSNRKTIIMCNDYVVKRTGETKQIPLTLGVVAIVDAEDYAELSKYKWHACQRHGTWYAKRNTTLLEGGSRTKVYMHRQIMRAKPGEEVDHRDGNGLNNTRGNIRICTRQENNFNLSPRRGTASRFKGVCWCKRSKRWYARIKSSGKYRSLGYFLIEEEAARAYDIAAREEFGDFAHLNLEVSDE